MKIENRIKISINSSCCDNNVNNVKAHIRRELVEVKILVTNYKCEVIVTYGDKKVTVNRFTNVDLIVETWFEFK